MEVLTDHDALRAVLADAITADPVRGTILGTIVQTLTDEAWLARASGGLAARSAAIHPVTVVGSWTADELATLAGLLAELPRLSGLTCRPDLADTLLPALPLEVAHRVEMRLFRLDDLTDPVGVGGSHRVADAGDRALVREWVRAFIAEADTGSHEDTDAFADRVVDAGECSLWLDAGGTPVSLAARRAPVFGSARVGPVYTPPEVRGRGYGSAVTATATRAVLDEGAIPVLFTDLGNPTSNKIYQLLGYRPVEDRVTVRFR